MSDTSGRTAEPRGRRRGLSRALVALAVSALSLAVALFLAERWIAARDVWGVSYFEDSQRYFREALEPVAARQGPEGQLFQNRPDLDLELCTFRYRTDGLRLRRGMEEPVFDPETFEGTRILCVGDSVTLGWGVDDEDTWVRLIEREGRAADGSPLACLNAGHLMFDSVQEAELLDAWGPRLAPDVVILTFVFNDLYPTWGQLTGMTRPEGEDEGGLPDDSFRWRSPGWLRSALPKLTQLLTHWRKERVFDGSERNLTPPFNFYPSGWPRCEAALERMRARCAALGADFVVFESNQYGPEVVELARWCEANGVPHYRIDFTAEEMARGVQNSRVDPHANELGNRLIADKVLAALRAEGLLAE